MASVTVNVELAAEVLRVADSPEHVVEDDLKVGVAASLGCDVPVATIEHVHVHGQVSAVVLGYAREGV